MITSFPGKKLRKLIVSHFKEFSSLSEEDCIMQFYSELKHVHSFLQETFRCALGKCQSAVCLIHWLVAYPLPLVLIKFYLQQVKNRCNTLLYIVHSKAAKSS